MGIETDPIEWEYGNNCLTCWDAGMTPKLLIASVSGIKIGGAWNPAMPMPPNGIHILTQDISPCYFKGRPAPINDYYETSIPGSRLIINATAMVTAFDGASGNNCVFEFANTQVNPALAYYGGRGAVAQGTPGSSPISIADLLELLNMDGRESRKFEFFPLDSSHIVAMFADQVESTRIRFKYKFT